MDRYDRRLKTLGLRVCRKSRCWSQKHADAIQPNRRAAVAIACPNAQKHEYSFLVIQGLQHGLALFDQ
ncbi:MAG: hypothetical protein RQ741_13845 [Wenzhouxiangellaceae bacterium]|nr:hypothetical protein [Wenzhouxiangellaceae bacterium]